MLLSRNIIVAVGRNFGGDAYVYDIDCGMVSSMYSHRQTHPVVYIKYVQVSVCQVISQ